MIACRNLGRFLVKNGDCAIGLAQMLHTYGTSPDLATGNTAAMFSGDAGLTAKDCADRDMGPSAHSRGSREGESWADEAVAAACSFSGDTEVLMADGSHKAISKINLGDKVLAEDPEAGSSRGEDVTAVWVHKDTLVTLNTAAGQIRTTENHPFWNASDQAWQPAEEIDPGEAILTNDGDEITVEGIDWSTRDGGVAYNLTVAELHTYFVAVGNAAVLVHNSCASNLKEHIRSRTFPGKQTGIRVVSTEDELESLFYELADGGVIIESGSFNGIRVRLDDETIVQYRQSSNSGGAAIDVDFADGTRDYKIHVQP
ncbi:MAG TPA: polymorphic toxin-type HINT domain-containing protein, partial [Thermomicrobiales bacterium]|nr:polymorphic toxin-type HINT domain-containing protein [Thermomicrobiales bacterium]